MNRVIRLMCHLPAKGRLVALLPGSRLSELRRHADLFVKTAQWLHKRHPDMHFVAPFVSAVTREVFERALYRHGAWFLPLTIVSHHSREAMAASDIVLLASGTATLEAALLKKPMVVTYKVSWLSYLLITPFLHVDLYALPNILAGRALVPEFIQSKAVPETLGKADELYILQPDKAKTVRKALAEIHHTLRRKANRGAADAAINLLKSRKRSKTM